MAFLEYFVFLVVFQVWSAGQVAQAVPISGNYTEADFYRLLPVFQFQGVHRRVITAPYGYRPGKSTRTNTCQYVRSVPTELRSGNTMKPHGLGTFYQKYTEAYGIPVLSSSAVPDEALKRACYTLRFLLAGHSAVRQSFYRLSGRVAVIGKDEGTTDIPEHSDMSEWWNQRARGLGATPHGPVSSGGEENVLCYSKDRYHYQDIFLHETSHGVHLLGAAFAISGWDARLRSLYNEAKTVTGLWSNTYSMSTPEEYFAEGTMSYFNVNAFSATANGIKGPISTRDKLVSYDPKLYNMIKEVFPCDNTYLKRCESNRAKENAQVLQMDCDVTSGGVSSGGHSGSSGTAQPVHNVCSDGNTNCPYWAKTGECTNNVAYMAANCKLSCGTCPVESCGDSHPNCPAWATVGECSKNSAYMTMYCEHSCGMCHTGPRTAAAQTSSRQCSDASTDCSYWKSQGHCGSDQYGPYMRLNCKQSCHFC